MIGGVILAAGRGARFGGAKLLATLPSGKTILETTVLAMTSALPSVTVVVRRDPALLRLAEQICRASGALLVVNENADAGMATSIASGVETNANVDGWLIALADMPYVQSATMSLVASQIVNASTIVVPTFGEQRGHPVGFGQRYFAQLQQLNGDGGARSLLQRHAEHVRLIPVDDVGIVKDIDTPADLGGR